MLAIGEVLKDVLTPEITEAWSQAVLFLAGVFIKAEDSIYKKRENRSGGWKG